MGTAGFEREYVRGKRRVPLPPPSTIEITLGFIMLKGFKRNVSMSYNITNFIDAIKIILNDKSWLSLI